MDRIQISQRVVDLDPILKKKLYRFKFNNNFLSRFLKVNVFKEQITLEILTNVSITLHTYLYS